jgi:hypothetical protein
MKTLLGILTAPLQLIRIALEHEHNRRNRRQTVIGPHWAGASAEVEPGAAFERRASADSPSGTVEYVRILGNTRPDAESLYIIEVDNGKK